jgi:hypothetical protein
VTGAASTEGVEGPCLCFDVSTGQIRPAHGERTWHPFVPQADGKPVLRGATLYRACCAGSVLALTSWRDRETVLRLFRAPDGATIREYAHKVTAWGFTLSRDGRRLARQVGDCKLAITDIDSGRHVFLPRFGGYHQDVGVEMGDRWLALRAGESAHLVHWLDGRLRSHRLDRGTVSRGASGGAVPWLPPGPRARPDQLPAFARYDPQRIVAGISGRLTVVVDCFGQVAVFGRSAKLVCMFFAFNGRIEAWAPDGTRWPGTGRGDEIIGAALTAAWERGGSATP